MPSKYLLETPPMFLVFMLYARGCIPLLNISTSNPPPEIIACHTNYHSQLNVGPEITFHAAFPVIKYDANAVT